MGALLQEGEVSPFAAVNPEGRSPFVLICEHASHTMPSKLGTLGLAEADLTGINAQGAVFTGAIVCAIR